MSPDLALRLYDTLTLRRFPANYGPNTDAIRLLE